MNSQVNVIEFYKTKKRKIVMIFGRRRHNRSVHHNGTPNNVRQQKAITTTLEMTHDIEFETIFNRLIKR